MISLINIIIMDKIEPIRIAKLITPIPKPVNPPQKLLIITMPRLITPIIRGIIYFKEDTFYSFYWKVEVSM